MAPRHLNLRIPQRTTSQIVGLWLAEGDHKTSREITFTNNDSKLKYFSFIVLFGGIFSLATLHEFMFTYLRMAQRSSGRSPMLSTGATSIGALMCRITSIAFPGLNWCDTGGNCRGTYARRHRVVREYFRAFSLGKAISRKVRLVVREF